VLSNYVASPEVVLEKKYKIFMGMLLLITFKRNRKVIIYLESYVAVRLVTIMQDEKP
jgi:hypothetical protein